MRAITPLSKPSKPALGPTQLLLSRYQQLVKRPGREDDHSPPSNFEVKNEWKYTPTPLRLIECTQTLHKVALLPFTLQRTACTLPYVFLMAENYKAKVGSATARLQGLWVRIPSGAWMFGCCQVEVSATMWSLVQRSPTDCGASLCVI